MGKKKRVGEDKRLKWNNKITGGNGLRIEETQDREIERGNKTTAAKEIPTLNL